MQTTLPRQSGTAIFKGVIFVFALWIAGMAFWGALHPTEQTGIFGRLMTWTPWAGYFHVVGGGCALILGGLQLSSRLRQRNIQLHRRIGQLYVICVLVGTVGAMVAVQQTTTSWHARYGFLILSFLWPTFTLAGYPWRGAFDVRSHGRLMTYSYAMTCAAITLRLYMSVLLTAGVRFPYAYPIAAWSSFLINIIVAFVVLRWSNSGTSTGRSIRIVPLVLAFGVVTSGWYAIAYAQRPTNAPDTDLAEFPHFTISTLAGTGVPGFSGDGGPALSADIQRPTAVAIDSKGNLYIADEQNNRVRLVTPDGTISTFVGTGDTEPQEEDLSGTETNLSAPYGIAIDTDDNLYVLNRGHNKIHKVSPDGLATRIVGTGEGGFSGDGGPAIDAQIDFTDHMAADANGNLYLADTGNQRIRRVTADGIIDTIVGTGERGFSGDGGPANEAQINNPVAIAVDTEGDLYIADQINWRVRVVTKQGRMFTVAGTGKTGHSGDGGPAERAIVSNPDIIAFDADENIYLPDHQNAVVRRLTPLIRPQ